MTERADILRLQAEIEHKESTVGTVVLLLVFFVPATYVWGKLLGAW